MESKSEQRPSFTYHPSLEPFNISPQAYLAANPSLTDLVVSALLFDTPLNQATTADKPPRTLLIQRAATDGYALFWECPGGGVELGQSPSPSPQDPIVTPDTTCKGTAHEQEHQHKHTVSTQYYEESVQQGHTKGDRTILSAVAREVFEETGLTITRVEALIDDTCEFGNKKGTVRARKFTFLVDFERYTGDSPGETEVTLNPAEHQDVMWVSEEEVVKGKEGEEDQGRKIEFAFEDQRDRILEGFRLLRKGF